MADREALKNFGGTAQGLAKNPLGIIALFIVLVYGLASVVVVFGSTLTPYERIPLVYFMVIFPVVVLGVFAWLVRSHSGKLFAPGDFKDEANYLKMQMTAVASLSAATIKDSSAPTHSNVDRLVQLVQDAASDRLSSGHVDHILWVDDRPENNIYERQAFEAVGLRFTLALSTSEAIQKLKTEKFAAIISDMGRAEGPREGYVLLDGLRQQGNETPLFFYATSNSPEHKRETADHGGQGCTNNPQELFQMVTRAVIRQRAK
jgi:CheY-like chemotaxis protein